MAWRCFECALGEHDNYDDDVRLVGIRDPDTGRLYRRARMCREHREMYAQDGYIVNEANKGEGT
jgi:hypothetical protein